MNLNLRLAEIDGKCPCEKPSVCYGFEDDQCTECGKLQRPNYLIPENLHELVRVAENVFEAFDIGRVDKTYYIKGYIEKPSKIFSAKAESLSAALAKAIVESKG